MPANGACDLETAVSSTSFASGRQLTSLAVHSCEVEVLDPGSIRPNPRCYHAMVATGQHILLYGGRTQIDSAVTDVKVGITLHLYTSARSGRIASFAYKAEVQCVSRSKPRRLRCTAARRAPG